MGGPPTFTNAEIRNFPKIFWNFENNFGHRNFCVRTTQIAPTELALAAQGGLEFPSALEAVGKVHCAPHLGLQLGGGNRKLSENFPKKFRKFENFGPNNVAPELVTSPQSGNMRIFAMHSQARRSCTALPVRPGKLRSPIGIRRPPSERAVACDTTVNVKIQRATCLATCV